MGVRTSVHLSLPGTGSGRGSAGGLILTSLRSAARATSARRELSVASRRRAQHRLYSRWRIASTGRPLESARTTQTSCSLAAPMPVMKRRRLTTGRQSHRFQILPKQVSSKLPVLAEAIAPSPRSAAPRIVDTSSAAARDTSVHLIILFVYLPARIWSLCQMVEILLSRAVPSSSKGISPSWDPLSKPRTMEERCWYQSLNKHRREICCYYSLEAVVEVSHKNPMTLRSLRPSAKQISTLRVCTSGTMTTLR